MSDTDAAGDLVGLFASAPFRWGLRLGRGVGRTAVLERLAWLGLRLRAVPPSVDMERLAGGIDLAATLAAGRPIHAAGLLEKPGQVFVLQAAERWEPGKLAVVLAAHDAGRCGLVALDDSMEDEALPAALADRCVLWVEGDGVPVLPAAGAIAAAATGPIPPADAKLVESLAAASVALGVNALRPLIAAARAACVLACWEGAACVEPAHAARAASLLLGPHATRVPAPPEEQAPPPEQKADDGEEQQATPAIIEDQVLAACRASLPAGLLAGEEGAAPRRGAAGSQHVRQGSGWRGRPVGSRAGLPRGGARLDLLATLRAAAPFQPLRGRVPAEAMRLRRSDLQVRRCRPVLATTTIFAVDASGSLAMARLAEAKGAVELLLADCYRRRDRVAVVAFRGTAASVLLEPTRAPARARRQLAGLPGGGGTPLACGLEAATQLAAAAVRRGEAPTIVLLTDGGANIGRAGQPGRPAARADAEAAARGIRRAGLRCLLIDTTRAGSAPAAALARLMGARYVLLPRADAAGLRDAVRAG